MSDAKDPQATPGDERDSAAGNTSDETQELIDDETTDDDGMPLENPSGG